MKRPAVSAAVAPALHLLRAGRAGLLADLCAFVRLPSVSAQPVYAADVRHCGEWLAGRLRRAGLRRAELVDTPGHPIVYAEWRGAPGAPTVLLYGHYDVQPAGPDAAWRSPPFAPQVRDGALYGRGASDDKGPILCHVAAIEAWMATAGRLPLNLVCLFEGEEEIGSPHLPAFMARHRAALAADAAVISDTRFLAPGRPALIYSLRGGLALELELRALRRDLHSGSFGGAVLNPIQVLCELLAALHTPDGRIAVPGIYRDVRAWPAAERRLMACNGPSDAELLREAGAPRGWGEPGFSLYERTTIRPALTINGIGGGYQGPGGKGVIPAVARAKLSFRLAPDQSPEMVEALVRRRLAALTPPGAHLRVRPISASRPATIDRDGPAMRAAARAYARGFGAAPAWLRSGGGIPVVGHLQREFGLDPVLAGLSLPDDRMHAPDERFRLEQLFRGAQTCAYLYRELADALRRQGGSRELLQR